MVLFILLLLLFVLLFFKEDESCPGDADDVSERAVEDVLLFVDTKVEDIDDPCISIYLKDKTKQIVLQKNTYDLGLNYALKLSTKMNI